MRKPLKMVLATRLFVTSVFVTPLGKIRKSPATGATLLDQLAAVVQFAPVPAPVQMRLAAGPEITVKSSAEKIDRRPRNDLGRAAHMFRRAFVYQSRARK